MHYQLTPIPCRPWTFSYVSTKLIESHYENNYGRALRRLNAITEQLEKLDWTSTPAHVINGLKCDELAALNSTLLHELYFASMDGQPTEAMALNLASSRELRNADRVVKRRGDGGPRKPDRGAFRGYRRGTGQSASRHAHEVRSCLFGAAALKVHDKNFAISSGGQFVVKLPNARVDALVATGTGERFDAKRGCPINEWLEMRSHRPRNGCSSRARRSSSWGPDVSALVVERAAPTALEVHGEAQPALFTPIGPSQLARFPSALAGSAIAIAGSAGGGEPDRAMA